ncbi:Acyl-CoA hydrolase [Polaromonas sp. OV174]|uniref:bifunctional acetyl-CoA hydrolase/transferase family protein/GNAT family N-acetyltransferase n=1 Tax=Polaromonas sp. OV174 TaxID=1855300 RepID=UPI0008E1AA22|nr:bifunctional acetyl-CoA hydrolase/transferase family protein/GNAT family N-acetyltransferase [Polaromonas sp. OV174]SFB71996.1 Acyl-CoA hydrolase [Polaromonas sp. OV174]
MDSNNPGTVNPAHGLPGPADSINQPAENLFSRLSKSLHVKLGGSPKKPADPFPGIPPLLQPYADKVTTAQQAVMQVHSGDHVFVGTACATPRSLVAALEARTPHPVDVELVHFLTDHAVPHDAAGLCISNYRHRTFFVGQDMRAAVKQGLAEYVPMSIARVPGLMAIGRIPVNVALIQVSPPDEFGYVNLGVSVDITPAAVAKARVVIAEVNPAMPRSMGESTLHISQIHYLVPVDTPVIEFVHHAASEQAMEQIARYIGGIIEDGSTLQIGLGRITNEALKYLVDRQDIGIHSDVITDAIIPLLERGILTGRRKSNQTGKIVTSFAMGSRRLYDLIDRNPLFSFQPIEMVCNAATIAAQHRMVSVTQAFAVDLTGQVCTDQLQGDFYSGVEAQVEFLGGASLSEGGKPIICLTSTEDDGQTSRIRAVLRPGEGATIPRTSVHYVITEFGIAYLFGKSIRERAVALIEVAHPKFRTELFAEAKALGYLPLGQTLHNMRSYAVEEEANATLKDQRKVLLRPATSSDGEAIRTLFHGLPEQDIYTRFFRNVRELNSQDMQRMCNLDFESEVAFVAVTGHRENPQIVGHSCYVIDASTNIAETAFMVHPEWQGCGLGSALQERMVQHAKRRGVRGFLAEILPSNEKMIRLARNGSPQVSTSMTRDTARVTTIF